MTRLKGTGSLGVGVEVKSLTLQEVKACTSSMNYILEKILVFKFNDQQFWRACDITGTMLLALGA